MNLKRTQLHISPTTLPVSLSTFISVICLQSTSSVKFMNLQGTQLHISHITLPVSLQLRVMAQQLQPAEGVALYSNPP